MSSTSNVTEVMYEYIKQLDVAGVCYEAIRQFYKSSGTKDTPVAWENASAHTRAAMVRMIEERTKLIGMEDATFEQIHNKRVMARAEEGWVYGYEYDVEKKTDPNMCSYEDLPKIIKMSDAIIGALVKVLTDPKLQLEQNKETV